MEAQNVIVVFAGGFKRDKDGLWHSSDFEGSDCGPPASHIRVLAGRYLYEENTQRKIIVSGGRGECDSLLEKGVTLSSIMKQELMDFGIPDGSILEDPLANNTYQSLRNLSQLIQQYGMRKIMLVSSEHHHLNRIKAMLENVLAFSEMNKIITLVSAENVVSAKDPTIGVSIYEAYRKEPFPSILAKETAGIEQIKNGTYRPG